MLANYLVSQVYEMAYLKGKNDLKEDLRLFTEGYSQRKRQEASLQARAVCFIFNGVDELLRSKRLH